MNELKDIKTVDINGMAFYNILQETKENEVYSIS